ncbi:MAG: methyltransferase domain-containing protein [Deltaproteobacteria bacterium]|nr:methyltransferase domain-containing protein [Deltaproteobacteria bacterium]
MEKSYPDDHWLKSDDADKALAAYMEQQSKAYSRIKNAFVLELLGDLHGKRFLDYGCGGGLFTVSAARQGALEALGVDSLETALSTARLLARREGVEGRCRFVLSAEFPRCSPRNRFDVVLIKDVIEHVPDDQALLDTAAEAMVPGGLLVVSTQNSLSLNYLLEGTYRRGLLRDKTWFGWDETHLRFYTPMSLNKKLKRAGFHSDGWRSVYLIPYKLPMPERAERQFLRLEILSWIDRILGGIFPYNRLGWNVIVRARASGFVPQRVRIGHRFEAELSHLPLAVTRESVRLK